MIELAEILNSLPYGIIVTDADLRLISVNTWLLEKLEEDFHQSEGRGSLSAVDLIGKSLLDVFHIDDRPKWAQIKHQLLSGEQAVYTENISVPGCDRERWLSLHVTAVRGSTGQIPGLIFSMRDITQGHQIENLLRSANFRLETLVSAVNLMSELQLDVPLMVESIVYLIADLYEAECVQYFFSNDQSGQIEKYIVEDRSQRGLGHLRVDFARLQSFIAEWGTTGFIEDVDLVLDPDSTDPSGVNQGKPGRILYSLVSTRSRVIGGMLVYSAHTSSFIEQDQMSVLGAITQQLGLYLDNAALYAEQQLLAVTDGLTGLINRRRLDEELVKEVKRSDRFQRPVSVLMMDIDNFKRINDTFGHPAGDRMLKHLAEIFMIQLRTTDIVARYGGEEFMIILPETDRNNAFVIAERLRKRVMEEGAAVIRHMAPDYQVTISIGIAAVPTHAHTPEDLVRAADDALYKAKRNGKNQVVIGLPAAG